ncbi:hypothetical protein ES703_91362 [subsurface metagenome]
MHILDDLFSRIAAHIIGKIYGRKDGRIGGKHSFYTIPPQDYMQIVDGLKQRRVIDSYIDPIRSNHRDHLVLLQKLDGDVFCKTGIYILCRNSGP